MPSPGPAALMHIRPNGSWPQPQPMRLASTRPGQRLCQGQRKRMGVRWLTAKPVRHPSGPASIT
eukprot:11125805-Karenia_brevis.AAC.1